MGETNVLFSIGPLEVTGAVVTMWVIVAVLALLSWLAFRRAAKNYERVDL